MATALPLFIAILVIFHSQPHLSSVRAHENLSSICPEEFECGKLGRMKFPFANFTQPNCGLSMLDCSIPPVPAIILSPSSGQWFRAKSRLQSNIINLYDPYLHRLLAQNSSCDPFKYIMFLPNSPSVSFTIKSNITLFRCRKYPPLSADIINYFGQNHYRKHESCDEFDVLYRNPKYHGYGKEYKLPPPICSSIILPMVPWEHVSEDTELFQLLTADFDLEWHVSDRCYRDCHLKGGRCETNEMNEFSCANATIGNERKNKSKIILAAAVSVGGIAVVTILVFCFRKKISICSSIKFWKCEIEKNQELETFLKKYESLTPKRYHYSDLKKMTNSFSTKLGQGGYGSVYKGKLQVGSLVAVKILNESKGNGEEFTNEVACISRTSHINIVTLLGFCFEGRKKALIYEFVANGSLEKFIYGEKSFLNRQLEWPTLYKIAVGIARGLEYLHCGCSTRILHFDIKPHNILLDEDFCPKITDFGLAKLCTRKESMISTMAARGTIGYIAPEVVCKNIGGVSHKSDVYSYGMMVLEMVGGRKNVDVEVDHASEIYFPHWIYTKLDQGEDLGLSGIKNEEEDKQARKMLIVSLWCIQTDPSSRPTINNVLEMLEGPFEALQMPPKFFFHAP